MQFNSYIFILLFLPVSVIGYFLVNKYSKNKNLGNYYLLAASVIFYCYAGVKNSLILLTSVIVNYFLSLQIKKKEKYKKYLLIVALVFNVGLLLYFKYTNFFVANFNSLFNLDITFKNVILPLGISFFTFQQIAYIINIYKNKLNHISFSEYALFILYFPKLIMGPLIEPDKFIEQIRDENKKSLNSDNIIVGIRMFNIGLFKKLLLADIFAKAVTWGFSNYEAVSSLDWIIISLSYTFEIYFDFSGYSDMAIGISKMLNIDLPINFNSPYKSYSMREFWKRWHMSLTNFLTNYIYIPLGGSKKGKIRTYINMVLVFVISGIWHGANWTFILWGLLNGAICAVERFLGDKTKNIHNGFKWCMNFTIINLLWLLFRAESITQWLDIIKRTVSLSNISISSGLINAFSLPELSIIYKLTGLSYFNNRIYGFTMIAYLLLGFFIVLCFKNTSEKEYKNTAFSAIVSAILLIWGILSLGSISTFVYFGF